MGKCTVRQVRQWSVRHPVIHPSAERGDLTWDFSPWPWLLWWWKAFAGAKSWGSWGHGPRMSTETRSFVTWNGIFRMMAHFKVFKVCPCAVRYSYVVPIYIAAIRCVWIVKYFDANSLGCFTARHAQGAFFHCKTRSSDVSGYLHRSSGCSSGCVDCCGIQHYKVGLGTPSCKLGFKPMSLSLVT